MVKHIRYSLATVSFALSVVCLALWGWWTFTLPDWVRAMIYPLWFPSLVFVFMGMGIMRFLGRFGLRDIILTTTVVALLLGLGMHVQ